MKKTFTKLWSLAGSILASWMLLAASAASAQTFNNPSPITIPSSGAATPYPSTINVSGGPAAIEVITVSLFQMSHTWPDDVDIVLVAPNGDALVLMADVGGSTDVVNIDLNIFDGAPAAFPDATVIASGSYRPTNVGAVDAFPAPYAGTTNNPAPAGTATFASVFGGDAADGDWSLFVVDDAAGDLGSINGGWSITFAQAIPGCTNPTACNYDANANSDNGSCTFPGCTDSSACNFDADAGCDDGSCCFGYCVTLTVDGGGFDGEVSWSFQDAAGNVVLARAPGQAAPFTQLICLPAPGCGFQMVMNDTFGDGWNGNAYIFTDQSGTILAQGTLAGGFGPVTDVFALGALPGCTDVNATNYNPNADCDNGACLYCTGGEQLINVDMTDTFGDGWNGATYLILDQAGGVVAQGSLDAATNGNGLTSGNDQYCLAPGCYTITVAGGSDPAEVGWSLSDISGNVILTQVPPVAGSANSIGFAWGGATDCTIAGCTQEGCLNYNPFATTDNGTCSCPPENDGCSDAIDLLCGTTTEGTLEFSTADANAISCNGVDVTTPGVWYRIIGTGEQITATTCASAWDTRIHVYSGSCGNLSCVTANDDACAGFASTAVWTSEVGVSYLIFVSKFSPFVTANDFTLEISCTDCPNIPINDACANAFPQPDNLPTVGSLCCSSADDITAVNPFGTGYGVWYTANSGTFDTFDFTLTNGDAPGVDPNDGTNVGVIIFQGACDNLTFVAACPLVPDQCAGSLYSIGVPLVPNSNYYFLVYTSDAEGCGNFTFTTDFAFVGCTDPAADNYDPANTIDDGSCDYSTAPANDLCADAIELTCGTTVNGSTGASTSTGAPGVCGFPADGGVWYFINGDGQFHTISSCGSAIDSRIEVVTSAAGCGGPYTCVASSDDDATDSGCGFFDGDDGVVEFIAEVGQVYYVYISAGGVDTNGDFVDDLFDGPFSLVHDCEPVVLGCLDACACNYDPNANVSNDACDYFSCVECTAGNAYQLQMIDTFGDGWNGNTYSITDGEGTVVASGSLDDAQCTIDEDNFIGPDSGFDVFCLEDGCYTITVGGGAFIGEVEWTLVDAAGNVVLSDADGGTLSLLIGDAVCGCTDAGACNFDPAATSNDGSCEYETCAGCTDPTACNFDATATIPDNDACCYSNCLTFIMNDSDGDGWNGNTATVTDLNTGLVVATATLSSGSTATTTLCIGDGCYLFTIGGGAFPLEVSWILTGTNSGVLTGGVNTVGIQFSVGSGNCNLGCTEPLACNYDPEAGLSDCSLCEYTTCLGCTYANATNYDPAATIDDGSCEIVGSSTCPADLDGNGIVNVSDLSLFLQDFGLICP